MSRALPKGPGVDGRIANVAVEAREAFARWVGEAPEDRRFAQIIVKRVDSGYELRHVDDAEREGLVVHEEPREAREISKRTEEGEYRPLKASPNLRRGWLLRLSDEKDLAVAMNHFYPAALVHWFLDREDRLEITNYRANAARQSGIYKRVQRLSDGGVQDAAKACCEDAVCLKRTLWNVDEDTPLNVERGEGEIPCPEPCSVFVSFARQVRLFEREKKRDLDAIGLSPTEKNDISALIGSAATGNFGFAREAEFGESLNERRLRYRRITLIPKLDPGQDDPEAG